MDRKVITTFANNVVRIDVSAGGVDGNGSGVVLDQNGTVLTCEHVVRPEGVQPDNLTVTKGDGRFFQPQVERLDRQHDVAVLRVRELKGLTEIQNYADIQVGDSCLIFGYRSCSLTLQS